jgi:RNA polymerase sigma-70 factor, ECF subfamily
LTTRHASFARPSTAADRSLDAAAAVFAEQRPRLFAIANRILGNRTDAEDIVQDVWLRWQGCDRTTVLNPSAFLTTATTRMAINASQSARVRRETCVGDWPSEPADTSRELGATVHRDEALAHGMQLLLERLTPTERAAYLLRTAFAYPYARIAAVLHLTEVNARQIVSRAGRRIAGGRRCAASSTEHRQFLEAFVSAAQSGDVCGLEARLVADLCTTNCSRRSAHPRAAIVALPA